MMRHAPYSSCNALASRRSFALVCVVAAFCSTSFSAFAQTTPPPVDRQAIMNEAKAAGAAAATPIRNALSETAARDQTPGYTSTPPQTTLAGGTLTQLGAAVSQRNAACAATPNDPQCAAEAFVGNQVNVIQATRPNMTNDSAVIASRQIQANPQSVIGSIGGRYSSCFAATGSTGVRTSDIQSCYNYYLREKDVSCNKQLTVKIVWQCVAGDVGPKPVTTTIGTGVNSVTTTSQVCTHTESVPRYKCEAGDTGPVLGAYGYVCTKPTGTPYFALPDGVVVTVTDVPATRSEVDEWSAGCNGYEPRVPPGLRYPDGVNTPLPPFDTGYTNASPTGSVDKCVRSQSICTASAETRMVDGYPIARSCWGYSNTYDCVGTDVKSDCSQPRFGQCTQQGAQQCVDVDPLDANFCTTGKFTFNCAVRDTTRIETELDCSGQKFTDREGVVWDAGYTKDRDFGAVATYMEAGRQAGTYLDTNSLTLFKGHDNRCIKKLYGLINCCNRGGSNAFGSFTNFAVIYAASSAVSGVVKGSKFVYDGLFTAANPAAFASQISTAFTGGLSALAGKFTLESLIPGPWQAAMIAITIAQMAACNKDDKDLALKRDAELCEPLGDYCSKKIIGCFERTQTYCCFNSRLARAVNVQGKAQLGIGMGSAQSPNCGGVSTSQLASIDLTRMNLANFIDEVKLAKETPAMSVNPGACYYQGQCTPPPR